MKKLVISEKKWLHGDQDRLGYGGLLLDGKMCCLGFAARQLCGATPRQIRGRACPSGVPKIFAKKLPWLLDLEGIDNSNVCERLMSVNDGGGFSLERRKKKIAEIFAKRGVKVVFVP